MWGPSLLLYDTINQAKFTVKCNSQACEGLDSLEKIKESFIQTIWVRIFCFSPVISAFFRIAESWPWKIEHLFCLSYLSRYHALRRTWLFKQQFVIIYSARILHELIQSKTMKYKLRSKQLRIQSKLIVIHGQYALKTNILISWSQLDHGNLYKQTMTTCAFTKVLVVKVFC